MQLGPVHARPASRRPHDASINGFCHLLMPAGGSTCIAPQVGGVALVQRVRGDGSDCRRTASGRTSASEHSDVSHDVGHHTFTVDGLRMTNGSPGGQRMHVRRRAWAGETRNCSADGRRHLRCHLRARSMYYVSNVYEGSGARLLTRIRSKRILLHSLTLRSGALPGRDPCYAPAHRARFVAYVTVALGVARGRSVAA